MTQVKKNLNLMLIVNRSFLVDLQVLVYITFNRIIIIKNPNLKMLFALLHFHFTFKLENRPNYG